MSLQESYPSYAVEIQRVSDGLVRSVPQAHAWVNDEDQSSLFWWTDGSAGCDCSMAKMFAEVAGEPDPNQACGESAYRLVRVVFPDGGRVDVQGAQ